MYFLDNLKMSHFELQGVLDTVTVPAVGFTSRAAVTT
jgi:hypothetical protein